MFWIVLAVLLFVIIIIGRAYSLALWQVPRYKLYWDNRATQSLGEKELRYFALGDSAAQAIGASQPEKGYVGRIADQLHKASGRPIRVINLGVSGAKAQDVLDSQLPQLRDYSVTDDDVITLAVGSNNIRDLQLDQFRQVMSDIIEKLPPQTAVADVPYFGGGRYRQSQTQALQASQIIRELVGGRQLRLASLQEKTYRNDSLRNYAADFFHPSDYGYQWWAAAFGQVLKEEYK